jgi:pilus assembly protein Flp/PilA
MVAAFGVLLAMKKPNASAFQNLKERTMTEILRNIWIDDDGQDVAEYALMLAVVLLVVLTAVQAIGTNANTIFTDAGNDLGTAAGNP